MTKPPADWQDQARTALRVATEQYLKLLHLNRLLRDALRANDYKAYLEAVAWFSAEEREP